MSYTFQNIDDATEDLNDAQFNQTRDHIRRHLFSASIPRGEGGAALLLNIYRLNFGGNTLAFGKYIKRLPKAKFLHAEYARANLAWNMLRVRVFLKQRGGRGLGDDEEGDYEDDMGKERGEGKDKNRERDADADVEVIWNALLSMDRVEKRNLVTTTPFPMEQPEALIAWYPNQTPFVRPGDRGSHLHESHFYEELVLRDFTTRTWERVKRAEKRRIDALKSLVDDLSDHSDSEFAEKGEEAWRPKDEKFWVYVEDDDGEERVVEQPEVEEVEERGGRYCLRKRKNGEVEKKGKRRR